MNRWRMSARCAGAAWAPNPRGSLVLASSLVQALRKLRILRRRPVWNWLRAGAFVAAGLATIATSGWWRLTGPGLALLALLLVKTKDPDAERRIQRMHRAEYMLNGGEWAGSSNAATSAALAPRTELYLLIRDRHLLLVPRNRNGELHRAVALAEVERVLVDGGAYLPTTCRKPNSRRYAKERSTGTPNPSSS